MAGFLRKKTKQDPKSAVLPPTTPSVSSPTPLFARFASAGKDQPAPLPRVVSGPTVLGKRDHVSHPRGQQQGVRNANPAPSLVTSETAADARNSMYDDYARYAAFSEPELPPQPPSKHENALPRVQHRQPSDLSSPPPQSSLPPNRRVSNRGPQSNTTLPPPDPLFPNESLFSSPKTGHSTTTGSSRSHEAGQALDVQPPLARSPDNSQPVASHAKMSTTNTLTRTAYHINETPHKRSDRGKPLIFTAMTTIDSRSKPLPTAHHEPQSPYPSPPSEYSLASSLPESSPNVIQQPRSYQQTLRHHDLPKTPPRARQQPVVPLRSPSDASTSVNGHAKRRLTKQRPTTPLSIDQDMQGAGVHYFADDPFAKSEMVHMLPSNSKVSPSYSKDKVLPPIEDILQPVEPEFAEPEARPVTPPPPATAAPVRAPPTPPSPDAYRRERRGHVLEKSPPQALASLPVKGDRPAEPFPLDIFLAQTGVIASFLPYVTFFEWLVMGSVSKKTRHVVSNGDEEYKELILERFLKTVGYTRWIGDNEPLVIGLDDLYHYMRGVTLPTHEYARISQRFLQTHPSQRDGDLMKTIDNLTAATRSYSRLVLRLRAQAEKETSKGSRSPSNRARSRTSSRAPSPAFSYSTHGGGYHRSLTPVNHGFKSPLFKIRRAPLLRCFVPSPDGDWLSDSSVLECEAELKRAGIAHLLRIGDIIWDMAVGDESNVGRLVWDGSYLIDLDYTYSTVGDLPKYLPTLAFSPSYFHRVIRTGPASTNPVVRIDLTPWGEEIAANLQLLQDRVRTETPQGTYHNVVRWVHRSSFVLRPHARSHSSRIPIPESNGLFIDSGWYGTVVVETEGTNESLADLQERCGPGAFPPRVGGVRSALGKDRDSRIVFRILREKSRPGEIWIRTVGLKERLN